MRWQQVARIAARIAFINFGIDPDLFLGQMAEDSGLTKQEFFEELLRDDKDATERLLSARKRRKALVDATKEAE